MTRTLVLNANPKPQSLCRAMAERYAAAAAARHEVQLLHLSDLDFEPNLAQGYDSDSSLEPDLQAFQVQLQWMEHLVIVTPVWWGGVPARFKGLLDRTLLPDFAFRYDAGKTWPEQLLRGRSSELIVTLDTPAWWYRWGRAGRSTPSYSGRCSGSSAFAIVAPVTSARSSSPIRPRGSDGCARWISWPRDLQGSTDLFAPPSCCLQTGQARREE